ncbi:xylan glycosyltransferase MUCI21-like [Rhodamnia argentea]|uniref:Xylan glycosyltransferase MUCI21-like n=1 Tax=Rhodamnia argentea TaxID=178133 RepID=A0A8B8QXP0_9MYRT|nr:xylan glycosyltransferase MUCI21-like [Rhodamnia argentea]XP_048136000.1 xylan glycosyltransferase MUCI21-like [Rhodamnia argentea]
MITAGAMKKRSQGARVVLVGLVFLAALLVLRTNVSTVSRLSVAAPPRSLTKNGQGTKKLLQREITGVPLNSQWQSPESREVAAAAITCDRSHHAYDTCTVNGPTLLHSPTSTFFLLRPAAVRLSPEKIRPHPRKWENSTMSKIKEFTLAPAGPPQDLRCDFEHDAPALVLSVGGYTGNFFHEFGDGLVPLFVTANTVFPGRDFVLVIDGATDRWIHKYEDLLQALSGRPVVYVDHANGSHCFPSASLGLISHGFMTINPKLTPNSRTFLHFRRFLDEAYRRNRPEAPAAAPRSLARRPRLVIAARTGGVGRVILNQKEVTDLARAVGFEVAVFEPNRSTPLREAYELINSSHALVGVHGAALTHTLFLLPGAVLGQVVPIGAGWVARACFQEPALAMGLSYVEYGIAPEESSLLEKYGRDHVLLKDPAAANGGGWSAKVMSVYLKEQNVRLDLGRFRGFLEVVYEKANKFMEEEGKGLN